MTTEVLDYIRKEDIILGESGECVNCFSKEANIYIFKSNIVWAVEFCSKCADTYPTRRTSKDIYGEKLSEQDVFYLRIIGKI
jgi:hypothetical protein